jgi:predicted phosphodiesterase
MEVGKIIQGAGTLVIILLLNSCAKDLDFSGLFYSDESANERFDKSMVWNSIHDPLHVIVPEEKYSYLIAGDSHVGGTINLDKFFGKAADPEISFILFAGDLTTGHEEDYSVFDEHLSNKNILPTFLIVGNHDLFFDGWESYYAHFGSSTYTFTVTTPTTTDLYICLETGSGTLGDKQLSWLTDILKNTRQQYNNCVVFSHTNFFRAHHTSGTNMLVEELGLLLELFADYNVDMVVMGHDHQRSEEWFGNTLYLTLDAIEDNFSEASYVKVTTKDKSCNYEFLSVN